MALAHEVLVPAHATVGRRLPRLAGQGRAVDHHHRHVPVTALGHHEPHVHLVDGDVAPGTEAAQLHLGLLGLLAADEEAALRLQHQGLAGSLKILECLRRHARGRGEDARKRDNGEHRRSAQHHRDSLTSHAYSPVGHLGPAGDRRVVGAAHVLDAEADARDLQRPQPSSPGRRRCRLAPRARCLGCGLRVRAAEN